MNETLDKIHEAVFTIAGIVTRPENMTEERIVIKHLFEALLGSVILPEMAKLDPSAIEDENLKKILEDYTLEKVKEMMSPKEKIIEVPREVIKTVTKEVFTGEREKFRRLKGSVVKESRKKRELIPVERKYLIDHWNRTQHRIGRDDAICVELAKHINEVISPDVTADISPLQIGGFFSHLSRMALSTESRREAWWQGAVKKGNIDPSITDKPQFSPELVRECQEFYDAERANEEIRKKEHAAMRAVRGRVAPTLPPIPSGVATIDFS